MFKLCFLFESTKRKSTDKHYKAWRQPPHTHILSSWITVICESKPQTVSWNLLPDKIEPLMILVVFLALLQIEYFCTKPTIVCNQITVPHPSCHWWLHQSQQPTPPASSLRGGIPLWTFKCISSRSLKLPQVRPIPFWKWGSSLTW
jgi:hypothetical protein